MSLIGEASHIPNWMAIVQAEPENIKDAYKQVIDDDAIQELLAELSDWETTFLNNHKKSQHIIHKATFLVDLGITVEHPQMRAFMDSIMRHISAEGVLQTRILVKEGYGGSGEPDWSWMLCDAPLLTYIAIQSGALSREDAESGIQHMIALKQEDGWPCKVDPALGKFRGPGGAKQICPYATLLMLKLLSLFPDYQDSIFVAEGVQALLSLWDDRKKKKPFLFAMGTDFQKLKAPLLWYDLLHVLDVLTRFEWARTQPQIMEMVEILMKKQDENGQFIPESIYMPWKQWEFGQKKVPSSWITLISKRILERVK